MFSFLWLYSMAALACALVSLVGGLPTGVIRVTDRHNKRVTHSEKCDKSALQSETKMRKNNREEN